LRMTKTRDRREVLAALLGQYRDAVALYQSALHREPEVAQLGAELAKRNSKLLDRARGDPAEMTRLIHETPQQQRIEKIRLERKAAEAEMGRLWVDIETALDGLNSDENRRAFDVLDRLSALPADGSPQRRIGLIEKILQGAGKTRGKGRSYSGGRVGGGDEDIEAIKTLIRTLRDEFSQAERKTGLHEWICKRLHNHPRPPNVKWNALRWDQAIEDEKHKLAVRTWISKALKEGRH
jgi:hypothetical protein